MIHAPFGHAVGGGRYCTVCCSKCSHRPFHRFLTSSFQNDILLAHQEAVRQAVPLRPARSQEDERVPREPPGEHQAEAEGEVELRL